MLASRANNKRKASAIGAKRKDDEDKGKEGNGAVVAMCSFFKTVLTS